MNAERAVDRSEPDILFDATRLIWRTWRHQRPTGIDRACLAYLAHYQDRACAVVQVKGIVRLLSPAHSRRLFGLLLAPSATFRRDLVRLLAAHALTGGGLDARALRGMPYLNVGHTGLNWPAHGRWVKRSGVKAIYYVHDLIPITHPQYVRALEPGKHVARMETVLRCGAGVIANSDDSLNALAAFAGERELALPPALKAPLCHDMKRDGGTGEPPLKGAYFVILGTIEARKNHRLLLDVWRDLVDRFGKDAPQLVIIGRRGWLADDVFGVLDEDDALAPYVRELGDCSDDMLRTSLRSARALLFPSFVEGQGLPLIEALSLGVPVLASDLAVFRETAGDIPEYFPPDDPEVWARAVMDYAGPLSSRRDAQIERLRAFSAPDWPAHFASVDAWIAGLLRSR